MYIAISVNTCTCFVSMILKASCTLHAILGQYILSDKGSQVNPQRHPGQALYLRYVVEEAGL